MNDSVVIGLAATAVAVILYVWVALALAAVFRKAGEEGWKAWVPFLNGAVVLQLGGFSGWLVLIVLVPLFGALLLYVSTIVAAHHINRSFGLGGGMTVLAALLFPVWASVVGFGSARWLAEEEGWGPVRQPTVALGFGLDESGRPRGSSSILDGPRPYDGPIAPLPPQPELAADLGYAPAPEGPEEPAGEQDPWRIFGIPADSERPGIEGAELERPEPAASEPARPADEPVWRPPATGGVPPLGVAPEPPAPLTRPAAAASYGPSEDDAFPEASGAVSAVVGAPRAGAPRSALSSVAAQHAYSEEQGVPGDADIPADETVVTRRRQPAWSIVPADGAPIPLSSERVIVGRRPASDPLHPDAQLVSIPDPTRTVSKTHALLRRRGETWFVTDLGSTNGVLFVTIMGAEVEAEPGVEVEAGERFLLGDLEVRIARDA